MKTPRRIGRRPILAAYDCAERKEPLKSVLCAQLTLSGLGDGPGLHEQIPLACAIQVVIL